MKAVFRGNGRVAISDGAGISDSTQYSFEFKVKQALLEDLAASPLSRAEIAMQLSARAGRTITTSMVEAWVAATKVNRFPAGLLPAWSEVLVSNRVMELLCGQMQLSLCQSEDLEFAELGRARLREEKLTQRLWEKI